MKWHPLALKFDALTGDEWASFLAGIKATKGVHTQPVLYRVVDGQRQGLDGRQRLAACKTLGLKCRLKRVRVPDDQVAEFILSHNLRRRHLSAEVRGALVVELRGQGMSTRKIADVLHTSQTTAARAARSGESNDSPGHVQGRDGKTYPTARPTSASPAPAKARYDGRQLLAAVDAVRVEIDRCAAAYGVDVDDDNAGDLRGLAVQLRVRLVAWLDRLAHG